MLLRLESRNVRVNARMRAAAVRAVRGRTGRMAAAARGKIVRIMAAAVRTMGARMSIKPVSRVMAAPRENRRRTERMTTISLKPNERMDDLVKSGRQIIQNAEEFCFSLDAVLLAHFVRLRPQDKVVDLAAGNGAISLLLAHVTYG